MNKTLLFWLPQNSQNYVNKSVPCMGGQRSLRMRLCCSECWKRKELRREAWGAAAPCSACACLGAHPCCASWAGLFGWGRRSCPWWPWQRGKGHCRLVQKGSCSGGRGGGGQLLCYHGRETGTGMPWELWLPLFISSPHLPNERMPLWSFWRGSCYSLIYSQTL